MLGVVLGGGFIVTGFGNLLCGVLGLNVALSNGIVGKGCWYFTFCSGFIVDGVVICDGL